MQDVVGRDITVGDKIIVCGYAKELEINWTVTSVVVDFIYAKRDDSINPPTRFRTNEFAVLSSPPYDDSYGSGMF